MCSQHFVNLQKALATVRDELQEGHHSVAQLSGVAFLHHERINLQFLHADPERVPYVQVGAVLKRDCFEKSHSAAEGVAAAGLSNGVGSAFDHGLVHFLRG